MKLRFSLLVTFFAIGAGIWIGLQKGSSDSPLNNKSDLVNNDLSVNSHVTKPKETESVSQDKLPLEKKDNTKNAFNNLTAADDFKFKPPSDSSILDFFSGFYGDEKYKVRTLNRNLFEKGVPFELDELPDGNLKTQIKALDLQAKDKALRWLNTFTFPAIDAVESLHADKNGGIFYACKNDCKHEHHNHPNYKEEGVEAAEGSEETQVPETATGPVPVSSPPVYNSKSGAPFHVYLDFNGGIVTGKQWNVSSGETSWDCKAWSSDSDRTTFSDSEQAAIRRMWERVSEDFAPFDINVTTDVTYDPDNYTGDKNKVGWLLITPTTDKASKALPHNGYGGIAYVGVFGGSNFYSSYQPAFVKDMSETNIAEAASHEMGHNLGLSHDTRSDEGYYGGHGSGETSWGPIMGTGYGRNISQWSRGEYYDSKHASWNGTSYDNNPNTNDDLALIAGRTAYRADDHGNTNAASTVLTAEADGSFSDKGIISVTGEVDVFSFETGAGSVIINANPYRCETSTHGGNLDILLELYDAAGSLIASNNNASLTTASISTSLAAGTYYVHIKPTGVGTPLNNPPSGYTVYGSVGQYTLSGLVTLPGVSIVETGTTDVVEGGISDIYQIALGTAPSQNVIVSINPGSQLNVDKTSVTFTPSNWSAKTITVTANNDSIEEGDHTGTITHSATSSDPAFNGIGIGSVIANIVDNDNIEVTSPNGGDQFFTGSSATIQWSSLMGGNVKIELFKGGSLESTIVSSTPNDGSYNWSVPVSQGTGTNFSIRISSVETSSTSDTSDASFAIMKQIYSDGFESGFGVWTNETGDDLDWTRKTGGTASSSTGPTGAQSGSYYIYQEASNTNGVTYIARIRAIFDLSELDTASMKFYYHMYGVAMGTLDLEASTNGGSTWTNIWSLSGDQGDAWQLANVDLSAFAGQSSVILRFSGTESIDYRSDFCLDNISITGTSVPPAPTTYTLTYNAGPGGSITGSASQSVEANNNGSQVTAVPNSGYKFVNWSDGLSSSSRTEINVTGNLTVTANFVLNNPPNVNAGPNQTVELSSGGSTTTPVSGMLFQWDASQDAGGDSNWASTTANTYTWVFDGGNQSPVSVSDARFSQISHAYSFPAAKDSRNTSFNSLGSAESATFEFVIDVDGNNGSIFETGGSGDGLQIDIVNGVLRGTVEEDPTEARCTYTLTATDMGRFIHVVFVADNVNDVVKLYVDGDLKDTQPWTTGNDWSGSDDGSIGSRYNSVPDGGSTADFNGKIALGRFYRNKAFTNLEVQQNFTSLSGASVTVSLNGSVSDADGDSLTTNWSVVSAPASLTFENASNEDTGATMTQAGTYVLRLTASDGMTQSSDDVTITVNEPAPPNTAPVANNGSVTTDEDVAVNVALSANDADGDSLTYSVVAQPSNGTLSGSVPNLTYTPNAGYSGSDSFTFKANDGTEDSNVSTISITVNSVTPPVGSTVALVSATNRLAWITFDTGTSDTDGNLSVSLTGAKISTGSKFGAGSLYNQNAGEYARIADNASLNTGGPWSQRTISVWFKLNAISGRQLILEEGGGTRGFNMYAESGTLYVGGWDSNKDGTDVDTWPGTWLNMGAVNAGQWYHVALVLDASANPTLLGATNFKGYLDGTLIASGNGMQISAHSDDFGIGSVVESSKFHNGTTSGNNTFNGFVDDLAIWNRSLSTAEISILGGQSTPNTAPVANNGSVTTDQDVAVDVALSASDADGDSLSYSVVGQPSNGTLSGTAPNLTYTPNVGFFGNDSLTFKANDGREDSNTATISITVNEVAPDNGRLAQGIIQTVGESWQTVTLSEAYDSMVVVATPIYTNTSSPAAVRIRNASGNSFEIKIQNPGDLNALQAVKVHYIAIEEGVYTVADHGIKMEAVKVNSSITDRKNSYVGQAQTFNNAYMNPVVVGQVMTANDSRWSVFWSRGNSTSASPSNTDFYVGKLIGEDSDITRLDETIAYIVVESGTGQLGSKTITASTGTDTIVGMGNGPKDYAISGFASIDSVVASTPGPDGADGGWPVLYGEPTTAKMSLVFDEDQIGDSERSHTSEQISYLIIGDAVAPAAQSAGYLSYASFSVKTKEGSYSVNYALGLEENITMNNSSVRITTKEVLSDEAIESELKVIFEDEKAVKIEKLP